MGFLDAIDANDAAARAAAVDTVVECPHARLTSSDERAACLDCGFEFRPGDDAAVLERELAARRAGG